jgi:NH3-dependent NAD+ synthetase
MLKFMSKMDQIIDSQNQMVNSHSESIAKIEAHEEEPTPIYWPPQQQYQAEPPVPMNSDLQDQLLKFMSKMDQIMNSHDQRVNSHFESIAKIKAPEEDLSLIYWPP